MSPDKLVHMANQIGQFFGHQPEDTAAANIADHLAKYWDPRMRKTIIAHLADGGAGLAPATAKAVGILRDAAAHKAA